MLYHHCPHQWPWGQGHGLWNFTLKFLVSFFSTFLLWKQIRQISGWTSVSLVTLTCGSWSEGQHDHISWATDFALDLEDYLMYKHHTLGLWVSMTWHIPLNKCRSLWPKFHGSMILPYILKTVWCMNILLRNGKSVWPDVWPKNKCRSLWPIFHGPVILPNTAVFH